MFRKSQAQRPDAVCVVVLYVERKFTCDLTKQSGFHWSALLQLLSATPREHWLTTARTSPWRTQKPTLWFPVTSPPPFPSTLPFFLPCFGSCTLLLLVRSEKCDVAFEFVLERHILLDSVLTTDSLHVSLDKPQNSFRSCLLAENSVHLPRTTIGWRTPRVWFSVWLFEVGIHSFPQTSLRQSNAYQKEPMFRCCFCCCLLQHNVSFLMRFNTTNHSCDGGNKIKSHLMLCYVGLG